VASKFLQLELLDNRYPVLHGLRAVAIVSVIQYHVTWILEAEKGVPFDAVFTRGLFSVFFGMDLFFILSGFLIGSIILHSIKTENGQNLRRFYLRRILRTFPSYYVVLTFLALTTALTAMQKSQLIYEYVYLTNFVSLKRFDIVMSWGWSLALEEQFYLTVPFLFYGLAKLRTDKQRLLALGCIWLSALLHRLGLLYSHTWDDTALHSRMYCRSDTRFDTIIAGIMLALVQQRFGAEVDAFFASTRKTFFALLFSATCLWMLVQPGLFGASGVQLKHVLDWGTLTSLMYFGFLLYMLRSKGPIATALSHPAFRSVATLGYGVYLVHIPVVDRIAGPLAQWLHHRGCPSMVVWCGSMVLVTALSLVLAYILHILVEKPSLRLRELWAR
jgi:peptidoglycan/LPS O-acetylase OafA/YrhL